LKKRCAVKIKFSEEELQAAQSIRLYLQLGSILQAIKKLEELKEVLHAAIPDKQRQSRGITWVVQRLALMMGEICTQKEEIKEFSAILYEHLDKADMLQGVPIFMMAEYGRVQPAEVLDFFEEAASAESWVLREFAQAGFRKLHGPNKEVVYSWLKHMVESSNPNSRRFVSEMLRPVVQGKWLRKDPDYSLALLRHLFHEKHPYPRTSVGNNLSDLSRYQPDLIFSIVDELVASKDKNSYWIAKRACRNLVKQYPERVLDMLGVEEYHYKDRHYRRKE
jgi:3-methyladenine DNA glycosylase AlkC